MSGKRDEFSPTTIHTLQYRVATLCSNPNCRCNTTSAHTDADKVTRIGVAAHMAAASPGGPRFDQDMESKERKSIENGIWLCENCATLIDKDPAAYPIELLQQWKSEAEKEISSQMRAGKKRSTGLPHIDIDLKWSYGGRFMRGYSEKNPKEIIDGKETLMLKSWEPQIIIYELSWNYELLIYNNSMQPIFNLAVDVGAPGFDSQSTLQKINHLLSLSNINLSVKTKDYFEGTARDADVILKQPYPKKLEGMTMAVEYRDQYHQEYVQTFVLSKGNFNAL